MNTINVKNGDVKTANLVVASYLVTEHKYSKGKAAEAAAGIVKKAKAKNPNFDGDFITKFTEQELSASVSKTASAKKEPRAKAELNASQLKIASNDSLTINERARLLLTATGFTKITAIATALTEACGSNVSFQRVTNVRKNMQKNKTGADEVKTKSVTAGKQMPAGSGKTASSKTATAKRVKKSPDAPKRKYTRKAK